MAKDFLLFDPAKMTDDLIPVKKDPATVIEPGKMITLDGSKLAIEATAGSTELAYAPFGAIAGETSVLYVRDPMVRYIGIPDQNFVYTDIDTTCDLVVSGGQQQLDLSASTTNVLKIIADENAGEVGTQDFVRCIINKPFAASSSDADVAFPLEVLNEGVSLTANAASMDFVGSTVTATNAGDDVTVTIDAQVPIQYQEDGVDLGTPGTALTVNFAGAGATATRVGNVITVTIP